jgi:hypothetical protein
MRMKTAALAALVLVMAFPSGSSAAPPDCEGSDLRVSLRLEQQNYTTEEPVEMKMVVTNKGSTCTMRWSDHQTHAFYVFDDDGKKIWATDACRGFKQADVEERWQSGHREVYKTVWRQWKNGNEDDCRRGGGKAEPGQYAAEGHFMGDGKRRTGKLTFRITG